MPRRKKKSSGQPELTGLELTLMQVIWERGDATAAEVREALPAALDLADTTIHTVLANLRRKGFIEPIPTVERSMRYAPCVPREAVAHRSLGELMQQFFGGSPKRLMAHLLRDEAMDEGELEEIRKMLRKKAKGGEEQ